MAVFLTPIVKGSDQVNLLVHRCALAPAGAGKHPKVVFLETAPSHPKVIGSIWSSLVTNAGTSLRLEDSAPDGERMEVTGTGRRYTRFEADCPNLVAGMAKAKMLVVRLVVPEALGEGACGRELSLVVLDIFKGKTAGQTLATLLEKLTPHPVREAWGDYLIKRALGDGSGVPLLTPRENPVRGYVFDAKTPWADYISGGVEKGWLNLASS